MPIEPGSRLGSYTIHSLIGAGGMGEVYRARDTKLDREVAIKVLPPDVAQDPERLARFEREAKSLAALNHPNIAQIYAVEDRAIVMELVPGAPLRGPLPIDTALEYAKQIASALEAAHEKGIVHRDLKPGNVMVTPDGVVKVLDFGLAGRTASDSSISQDLSPTLTVHATQAGIIIGTAGYMSPEQAAGKPVDKRADIWSFGVMLWELLVGARLFDGETVSHTLADVLRAPVDLGKLPSATPSSARRELSHTLPVFLPDGRTFIYFNISPTPETLGLYAGSLDVPPESQSRTRLAAADSGAVFVPSSSGHPGFLLFVRQGNLVAQPLDGRWQLADDPVRIAEDVGNTGGYAWFSASASGALAYRSGRLVAGRSELVWFDRQGKRLGRVGPPMDVGGGGVTLSRDGKRVAVTRLDSGNIGVGVGGMPRVHVWTADLARGIFSRVNQGPDAETSQVMTPDGRVVYSTTLNAGVGDIYWAPADGTGTPEPLITKSPTVKHPNDVSPDGRFLVYDDHTTQRQDLWILPLARTAGVERKPVPFLVTSADETFGQFSPDGKWIAYDSDESGIREVYVQGFAPDRVPAAAFGKWQISTAGGEKPRWSRDGKELYYIAPDRKLMAVPVTIGQTFEPGLALPLFETNGVSFFPYAVGADGRFLINTLAETPSVAASPVTMVLNWQSDLTR